MPESYDLALFFRWASLAGMALTAFRLWRLGLRERYSFFFAFMVFGAGRTGALLCLDVRSGLYAKIWILTEPALWLFYGVMLGELYGLILERYKGLASLGKWFLYFALTVAGVASLVTLMFPSAGASRVMGLMLMIERALLSSLLVFLFLTLFFVSRYPLHLNRNLLIHAAVFSVYFLSYAVSFLIRSMLGPEVARAVNLFMMGVNAGCVVSWSLLLNAAGERREAKVQLLWSPEEEQRLVGQLSHVNSALLHLARKS
jgi:hypothetical protein